MEEKTALDLQEGFLELSGKYGSQASIGYFVEGDGTGVAVYNFIGDSYLMNLCTRLIRRVAKNQNVGTTVVLNALRRLIAEGKNGEIRELKNAKGR